MRRSLQLAAAVVLAGAPLWLAPPLAAQPAPKPPDSGPPDSGPADRGPADADEAPAEPKLADVQATLKAIADDSSLENATKSALQQKYQQAIDVLEEAAQMAAKAKTYRESIDAAPAELDELRAAVRQLPTESAAGRVTPPTERKELQTQVDSRRAERAELSEELTRVTGKLAGIQARPVELSARIPEAERQLAELVEQLAAKEPAPDGMSPARAADRTLLEAQAARLRGELAMLKQEQLSLSAREDLLKARETLLTRQVENAAASLQTLDAALAQRLDTATQQVADDVDQATRDLPQDDLAAQALAHEIKPLAKQFEQVVQDAKRARAAQDDLVTRLQRLTEENESIRRHLELGSAGGAMAHVLFDLQRRILNPSSDSQPALPDLEDARFAALEVAGKLRRQSEIERKLADRSDDAVARLLTTRAEVLEQLDIQYRDLTAALAALEAKQREYQDQADKVVAYTQEQLFWMRSSAPLSTDTLREIPGAVRWAFGREHLSDLVRALRQTATAAPLSTGVVLLLVVALVAVRRQVVARLEAAGSATRRISTDRFSHTVVALVCSMLLAAPLALLMWFAGWALAQHAGASGWLLDAAFGLRLAARITLGAGLLAAVCRPGGLAAAHFGWRPETLARLRSAIVRFAIVYVPALLLISYRVFGVASQYFDSVGRLSFMLAHLWAALVVWQLFRQPDGVLDTLARHHAQHVATRWRYLWFPLVLAAPLTIVVLAGLGYLITAVELSIGLLATLALIAGGTIAYGLAVRWFTIRLRRLAWHDALERRRAALEQRAAAESSEQPTGEVVLVDPEDEAELDLDASSRQTKQLLRTFFGLLVAAGIIMLWSGTVPLIAVFDEITVPLTGGRTLLVWAKAALVAIIVWIAVKDLPGLLDLGVLRATSVEAGTRYAIATLCQYAVIAVGLTVIFNLLEVDWAKLGWIAAALSVGLGFGLQEIVANFVCGIILLFERPIRVGDVVTVEGTTGTVTRIRMRATTIINWDRKEFVVPNKSLITGTILNWTLSATINRIVIPVGVAYGTDTDRARQILLDVAADHPLVVDDPPPLATFEEFADSSLKLLLYVYLANVDGRLRVTSELHAEIDKRFAAAGIEIAFPQLDLHVRSAPPPAAGPRPGNGIRQSTPGESTPL